MKLKQKVKRLIALVVVAALFAPAAALALTIEVSPEPLETGAPATVRLVLAELGDPGAGATATLRAVTYPDSEVEAATALGTMQSGGSFEWVPSSAGLIRLEAVDSVGGNVLASRLVSVRYASAPLGAVLVFLFASTLLIGGLLFGATRMKDSD